MLLLMKMAHFVDRAAKLIIAFGVILNSKASDNETALYLSDEVAIQLTATNNNNIPTDYSTPVSVAYVTEVAETTTKITLMVTAQPGSDTSEESDDITTTTASTKRTGKGRSFPMAPHYHLPDSRWGPFFEEGSETQNVTTRVGSSILLDCRIGLLQDKMVTWLHHKDNSIHLLTVGKSAYSRDERITLSFRYPNNFRLEIVYVTRRDEGLYECQVSTHPPKVKRTFLIVTVPEIKIVDESGHKMIERYYKAGSALELTCIAINIGVPEEEPAIIWKHGERILSDGISYNVSDSTDMAISTLTLTPLMRMHSGNYTCTVGSLATATVNVQVLNGELPAAVHDGNSVPAGTVPNIAIVFFAVILAVRRR